MKCLDMGALLAICRRTKSSDEVVSAGESIEDGLENSSASSDTGTPPVAPVSALLDIPRSI